VTKNASLTRIAKPAATMKHGQAAETTGESSLITLKTIVFIKL
jgi:hypothetical protein